MGVWGPGHTATTSGNLPTVQGTPRVARVNEMPGMSGAEMSSPSSRPQFPGQMPEYASHIPHRASAVPGAGGWGPARGGVKAVLKAGRIKVLLLILAALIVTGGGVGVFALTHQSSPNPFAVAKPNTFAISGAVSGTLVITQFRECDTLTDTTTNQSSYRLFMTGRMNQRSYDLNVSVDQYHGPGTYTNPQQISVVFDDIGNTWGGNYNPITGGSISVGSGGGSGSISSLVLPGKEAVFGTQVQITGSWQCETIGEPVQ